MQVNQEKCREYKNNLKKDKATVAEVRVNNVKNNSGYPGLVHKLLRGNKRERVVQRNTSLFEYFFAICHMPEKVYINHVENTADQGARGKQNR